MRRRVRLVTVLALAALAATGLARAAADVRLAERPDGSLAIDIGPLTAARADAIGALDEAARQGLVSVRSLGEDGTPAPVGMLGSVEARADGLRFVPRFPLVPGLRYRVTADWSGLAGIAGMAALDATIAVPPSDAPRAEVVAVYPSAERLPANLLRLYLHFSQPMARGEAYRRVRLVRADGSAVADPFLQIDEELWDAEQRRLTLFFDPGRIKRGLRPHAEAGPPLAAGDRLRLVIDAAWQDGHGRPLLAGFDKAIDVVDDDRRAPSIEAWEVTVPAAGSRDALEVRFAEPLDHALALRMIRVERGDGRHLAGRADLDRGEQRWRFVPERPWRAGRYRIVADSALEDRAGNSLRGVFDRDLEQGQREVSEDRFVRAFAVVP